MRIALLSANRPLAAELARGADGGHWKIHVHETPADLSRALTRESFDLLLVDGGAFEAVLPAPIQRILVKANGKLALMLINGHDSEDLLAAAFALGIDDFVRRSATTREICARIDAVLRRLQPMQQRPTATLEMPPYAFNVETRTAYLRGKEMMLTHKEFDLAYFLFRNVGRQFSRNHLLESVWRTDTSLLTRTVDTHISRIRSRLQITPDNGYRVVALYGNGYRLERTFDADHPQLSGLRRFKLKRQAQNSLPPLEHP